MYTWTDGAYLMHHGIKGQRWGVRRFQNEDGSYTDAGLKRYGRRQEKIGEYKKRIESIKEDTSKTYRDIYDLNKHGTGSELFRKQLFEDTGNPYDDYSFYNTDPRQDNSGVYASREEAFNELFDNLKTRVMINEGRIKQYQEKIEILKNAKITDRTFLENEKIGEESAVVASMAAGAASIGANYMRFGLLGCILCMPFTAGVMVGAGALANNAVGNIGIKEKKYRTPKDKMSTYDSIKDEFMKTYGEELKDTGPYENLV